jgi:thymidylate synthase (FAD)
MIESPLTVDERMYCVVLSQTTDPQTLIRQAMGQDYSENAVFNQLMPAEDVCGGIVVKNCLSGNRGHYGILEHPSISFNVVGFPHSVMQQLRTHRSGITFDVQSGRYTGKRIYDLGAAIWAFIDGETTAMGEVVNYDDPMLLSAIEDVFYLRPAGEYRGRKTSKYIYDDQRRLRDLQWCAMAAVRYYNDIDAGLSEEHARGTAPFDFRQHFVVSFNLRTAFHLLDLRYKPDAQLECQRAVECMIPGIRDWVPEIFAWYVKTRLTRGVLAP